MHIRLLIILTGLISISVCCYNLIRFFNNNIHRKNPTQFGLAKSSGNAILSKHSQPNREIIESQKKIRPKA
jgi:hypothetical protein